jgi:site-specific DNA-cytosine methylase
MVEVDLILRDGHDLYDDEKLEEISKRVKQGDFDAIIMSPPCSTWSRAVWLARLDPGRSDPEISHTAFRGSKASSRRKLRLVANGS